MYSKQNVLAKMMNAGLYNVKVVIADHYFAKGEKVAVITRPDPKRSKWIVKGIGQLDEITAEVTRKFEAISKVHEWLDRYVEPLKAQAIETVVDDELSTTEEFDDTIAIPPTIEELEDAIGEKIPSEKIKADRIDIIRGERNEQHLPDRYEIRRENTANVWATANEAIAEIAETCTPEGSYLKTSFMIYWADGETYDGNRLDIKHPKASPDDNDLADHIFTHLRFYTGDYCPSHMTQETYDGMIKGMTDENRRQECRDMLSAYQIGDTEDNESTESTASDSQESENDVNVERETGETDELEKQPNAEMDAEDISIQIEPIENIESVEPAADQKRRERIRKEFGIHADVFSQLTFAEIDSLCDRPDDIPYDNVDYLRFQALINASDFGVRHYQGLYWWKGPSVSGNAEKLIGITLGITLELQQDELGKDVIFYPGTKGARLKSLFLVRSLQSAFFNKALDPNDERAVNDWLFASPLDQSTSQEETPALDSSEPEEMTETESDPSPLRAEQIKTLAEDEIESFFNDTHSSMSRAEVDTAIALTAHEIKFEGSPNSEAIDKKSLALNTPSFGEISTALSSLLEDAVIFKVERQTPNEGETQWEFQPHNWRFDLVDNKDENRRTKISLISAMICTDMQGDEINTYAIAEMMNADLSVSDTLETLFDQMCDDFIIGACRFGGDENVSHYWTLITRDEYDALQDKIEEVKDSTETPHEIKGIVGFICIDENECRDESGATWVTLSYRWEGVATARTAFICLGGTFYRGTVMIIDEATGEMYERFTVKYDDFSTPDKGRESIKAIYNEVFGDDESPSDKPESDEKPSDDSVAASEEIDQCESIDQSEPTLEGSSNTETIDKREDSEGESDETVQLKLDVVDKIPTVILEKEIGKPKSDFEQTLLDTEPCPASVETWIYDGGEAKRDEEDNEWHIVRYYAEKSPHKKARYAFTLDPVDDEIWHGTLLFQNGSQWKEEFKSYAREVHYPELPEVIGAKWEAYFGDSSEVSTDC